MSDLIAQATDPAPHPEETQEGNNEQSQSWRPANTGGGAAVVLQAAILLITELLLQLQLASFSSSRRAVSMFLAL